MPTKPDTGLVTEPNSGTKIYSAYETQHNQAINEASLIAAQVLNPALRAEVELRASAEKEYRVLKAEVESKYTTFSATGMTYLGLKEKFFGIVGKTSVSQFTELEEKVFNYYMNVNLTDDAAFTQQMKNELKAYLQKLLTENHTKLSSSLKYNNLSLLEQLGINEYEMLGARVKDIDLVISIAQNKITANHYQHYTPEDIQEVDSLLSSVNNAINDIRKEGCDIYNTQEVLKVMKQWKEYLEQFEAENKS